MNDVIVIGGGQSGLAVGYYLRRTGLSFVILDREKSGGGSWQHHWKSLRLFSPAQWSSLPGVMMPGGGNYYPSRDETVEYLRAYEARYSLPVERPVEVFSVTQAGDIFEVHTNSGDFQSRAVVSATGTFGVPVLPDVRGAGDFQGIMLHSSQYTSAERFRGKRVAVVGEGNSGAQILAELSGVADTLWITRREPRFLPDHIDGRYLFDAATQIYEARKVGRSFKSPSFGDIVMVEPVKAARERRVFENAVRPFERFSQEGLVWADGRMEAVDAVVFCTGFRPSLDHLGALGVINDEGRVDTNGTRSTVIEGLWLVGYGSWTGFASATLIGVGRSARAAVEEIKNFLAVEAASSAS